MEFAAVILAAGKGTRMKSDLPKVIHPILGRPMVNYVVETVRRAGIKRTVVVVGFGADNVEQALPAGIETALQAEQLGTGHAVMVTKDQLAGFKGGVIVLAGDVPLITVETIQLIMKKHEEEKAAITCLTAIFDDPSGYGHIVRDAAGKIVKNVEHKDADDEQKKIKEINSAIYCFDAEFLYDSLSNLKTDNAQGEYYLTDLIGMAVDGGKTVTGHVTNDNLEITGINNRAALADIAKVIQSRINREQMMNGVTLDLPETIQIEPGVEIERDVVIKTGCSLRGATKIKSGAVIGPHSILQDAVIEADAEVPFGLIENATVKAGQSLAPFSHITG